VPTLKGTEALVVPAGTQHGEVFKLKGKGLPDVRSLRGGDELVQIVIEVPKKLNERQKQLLREFAASEEARIKQQRKGFFDKIKELIKGEHPGGPRPL
jgi:molecular chaperone DnaJ